ncbi:O-antigen ligase family protein [Pantoea cypripedii]|uniref:Polymerase n=1 Tax=Pantoea cypripedii TaxID=55209 RepID=A0A6B9GFT4_PANCY|nr:O-antigen ligase family protein [Pantoea cypripedii]QGY32295.1 polymerase [Pantoea cypripedii]
MYLKFFVFLSLVTSVPLLFIIPGGTDVPLSFVVSLFLFPSLVENIKFFFRKKLFAVSVLILMTQIISLLWSIKVSEGFRDICYMLSFWFLISGIYSLHKKSPDSLLKIIKCFLILVCFEAVTIIIFRLLPEMKLSLVLSPPMRYLLGQNVLDSLVLEGARNNFYDPEKSGGLLFINANIAACYVGISSFLSYNVAKLKNDKLLYAISFVLWFSVFFSGSKASAIFAILIPGFIYIVNSSSKKRMSLLVFGAIPILALLLYFSIFNVDINNTFLTSTADTTDSRMEIWSYGVNSFIASPILGLGYGGWMAGYAKIATVLYPPHNTIMYMWAKSGIFSAFFGLLFIYLVIKSAFKSISSPLHHIKRAGTTLLMVSGWLFLHGFGENFGLIGDPHQMIVLAIAISMNFSITGSSKSNYEVV